MTRRINDTGTLEERFAKYVIPGSHDECWPWLGTINDKNYGQLWNESCLEYAHRIAYELASGEKQASVEKLGKRYKEAA